MSNILNITNGDSAVEIMKQANIPGVFLPWRDVLHEGPVPDNLSLEELSEVRAQFIIARGWGEPEKIIESFIQRDNELKSFNKYEKVILWFEHDLYDQLQIIQILDWFYQNTSKGIELSIICTDRYLGLLTPEEMGELIKHEEPITESHLKLSSKAWSAIRSSSPDKWFELLNIDTTVLPFLEGAVVRLLEEYPGCTNGLSRTAEQALKVISSGEKRPGKIFSGNQELEERMFLGDASFWVVLHELLKSNPPLIALPEGKELTLPTSNDQALTITPAGIDVLAGKLNWLEVSNIDHWIGGVHLEPTNVWCWNSISRLISKRA
jgi:Domain of unknown function (DUF1835)